MQRVEINVAIVQRNGNGADSVGRALALPAAQPIKTIARGRA